MNNIGIIKIGEYGYDQARIGVMLSYHIANNREPLQVVAEQLLAQDNAARLQRLAPKDWGENKFLEAIDTWWLIRMPRDWWSQFDTYRHAMQNADESVAQSESTMHTLLRRTIGPDDFSDEVCPEMIATVNYHIIQKNLVAAKRNLAEGFLQTRDVKMNYRVLRNILLQRSTHYLEEWRLVCDTIRQEVEHPELLP